MKAQLWKLLLGAALLIVPVLSITAQPDPVLDEDAATAFFDELAAKLEEVVEDEDSLNSIYAKWETRELAGKTKKQIIQLLFNDVRSVIKDAAVTNKIWASWNPAPQAPTNNPVPGPALRVDTAGGAGGGVLDNARKANLGSGEMSAFFSQTGKVKAFVPEKGNYKGQFYTIYKDSADPNLEVKVAAVHRAVKTIVDKGVNLPADLRVYSTNAYEAQNRAFQRDANWNPIAYVILGPAALTGGRTDALSATGFGGFDKPTITTIHEIGHILHERSLGDPFWATGSIIAGQAGTGGKVTGYAAQNKKEFVAEVFAGMIIGKQWGSDVLDEYTKLGGPKIGGLHFFIARDW